MKFEFDLPTRADQPSPDITVAHYRGPALADLDERGRRLLFSGCDLLARFWLNDTALPEFDAKNFEGAAMMIHAEQYLADRLAYELFPWPKGMIKVESEDSP